MANVDKFTSIHPEANLADSVTVGPFSTIHENVEIGEGTVIDSNVTIFPGARIGKNCHIFPGAVISAIPQDLKFAGEDSVTIIGNNTTIRECVTIHRGTASKGKTIVGNNCLIMAYSHIAHDCVIGNNIIIANASQLAGEVVVDDFAVIGGGSLIHQFCHIGCHVILQGGVRVGKDIPPFVKAAREPVAYTGINSVGLHRRGFSEEAIEIITETYRKIYFSRLNVSDAVAYIRTEMSSSPERETILTFIENSERGIVRGYSR